MTKYRRHTTNSNPVVIRKPAKTTTGQPAGTESSRNSTVATVEEIYKTILRKLNLEELTAVIAMAHQNRDDRGVELLAIAVALTQYDAKDRVLPDEWLRMILAMKEDSMYALNHNNRLPENGVRWLEILQAEYGKRLCSTIGG